MLRTLAPRIRIDPGRRTLRLDRPHDHDITITHEHPVTFTSTDRQNLVLDEAGIEDPVVFEQQAGTSSLCTSPRCSTWYAAPGTSSDP
ncbi:hypothetical protein ABZ016_39435 [Streptomyces sp. NPDC006372]|uniref:hypothetical protein n=1 Tax=Streptomyces sp. NPDC006372 TaxID=3155599 RepID=UPI0033AF514F